MEKFELVFIPGPGMGHLASIVEMANILVTRDDRLSITVLAIKLPNDAKTTEKIQSLSKSFAGKSIHFTVLPELPLPQESEKGPILKAIFESYKPLVREAVAKLVDARRGSNSPRLVGFVIDMFCTTMIDVAKEFEVPCYVFYTSGAGFLALSFHLQELYHKNNSNDAVEQLQNSDAELVLPGFVNPIPGKVIPDVFFEKEAAIWFHTNGEKLRAQIRGLMTNTFAEMESHVLNKMSSGSSSQVPPIYSVGPVLHLKNTVGLNEADEGTNHILKWLDDQPTLSVVFLCFGSMGSFEDDQVKEIAQALERSGVRFLWSLRRPPPKGQKFEAPSDYVDVEHVLPKGFLERTASIGKVIGWAPQVEILAHPATGGFVSHCGWNSILESIWHGVPIATWPMYAEQQFNAFELVVELGLAVEITIDYRKDSHGERSRIISAEVIESGLKKLMDNGNEIRKKVKTKKEESRKSVMEGGSSFISLGHFIDDVLKNSLEGVD